MLASKYILAALTLAAAMTSSAQQSADTPASVSITEKINDQGVITVKHSDALEQRIKPLSKSQDGVSPDSASVTKPTGPVKKIGGFRVQVFSDNNSSTAKNEARSKGRIISARFPQYGAYVIFNSPYWRLRVGDFRTREEAEAAATEIKRAFPAYSREIRVVPDRINVQQ